MNSPLRPTRVPDWAIQSAWAVSGVFATGALWYFLSVAKPALALASAFGALGLAGLAISLHRAKDFADLRTTASDEFVIDLGEERITFTEKIRSMQFDIVKVNAHTHALGVMAEHKWLQHNYPKAKVISQALTTMDRLNQQENQHIKPIHFDVMKIDLGDRIKDIYFDISAFICTAGVLLDPASAVAAKLNEVYK